MIERKVPVSEKWYQDFYALFFGQNILYVIYSNSKRLSSTDGGVL